MSDYVTAEPFFDWEKGEFVIVGGAPRLATGKERIKNSIQKRLRTQLNKYKIYRGTGYGVDSDGVKGEILAKDYRISEMKRNITEALLQEDGIISIDNFSAEQKGRLLNISFAVNTEFGDIEIKEEV